MAPQAVLGRVRPRREGAVSAGTTDDWAAHLTRGDDGVWLFWPPAYHAAYPAHLLRAIADHLDRMNSEDSK